MHESTIHGNLPCTCLRLYLCIATLPMFFMHPHMHGWLKICAWIYYPYVYSVWCVAWWHPAICGNGSPHDCVYTDMFVRVSATPLALKGLSHEIFGPVYWPVWMHLGLNMNRFWFLDFEEAPSIWGSHFKFWCVSVQTFSEILRISEKGWQLRTQLPILLRDLGTQLPILIRELVALLPIILGDSTILREIFTPWAAFFGEPLTKNLQKLENRRLSCQKFSEILGFKT